MTSQRDALLRRALLALHPSHASKKFGALLDAPSTAARTLSIDGFANRIAYDLDIHTDEVWRRGKEEDDGSHECWYCEVVRMSLELSWCLVVDLSIMKRSSMRVGALDWSKTSATVTPFIGVSNQVRVPISAINNHNHLLRMLAQDLRLTLHSRRYTNL